MFCSLSILGRFSLKRRVSTLSIRVFKDGVIMKEETKKRIDMGDCIECLIAIVATIIRVTMVQNELNGDSDEVS